MMILMILSLSLSPWDKSTVDRSGSHNDRGRHKCLCSCGARVCGDRVCGVVKFSCL